MLNTKTYKGPVLFKRTGPLWCLKQTVWRVVLRLIHIKQQCGECVPIFNGVVGNHVLDGFY